MEDFLLFLIALLTQLQFLLKAGEEKQTFTNPPQVWHCVRRSVTGLQNYLLSLNILLT